MVTWLRRSFWSCLVSNVVYRMHLVVELVKQIPCSIKKSFIVKVVKDTLVTSQYDFLAGGNILMI